MRGTVQPVRMASLTPNARDTLEADIEIPVVSLEDVYGGKLMAAMDRQHPRDLFDVMQLFAHEGITAGIRRAFVVYLASHNRPVHEVLFPSLRDIRHEFEHNFVGMTAEPVELDVLLAAREQMMRELQQGLTEEERQLPAVPRHGRTGMGDSRHPACREASGRALGAAKPGAAAQSQCSEIRRAVGGACATTCVGRMQSQTPLARCVIVVRRRGRNLSRRIANCEESRYHAVTASTFAFGSLKKLGRRHRR